MSTWRYRSRWSARCARPAAGGCPDAYELANLLRLGSLPEAYIAPPDLRELRELVRHRRQLVKLSTAVKAGMRALLAKHNIRLSATQLDVTPRPGCWTRWRCPAPTRPGWPRSGG